MSNSCLRAVDNACRAAVAHTLGAFSLLYGPNVLLEYIFVCCRRNITFAIYPSELVCLKGFI